MPVLLEDGKVLTQSASTSRYLARKYGYVSEDPFLNYRSEQVMDILEDARKGKKLFFVTTKCTYGFYERL